MKTIKLITVLIIATTAGAAFACTNGTARDNNAVVTPEQVASALSPAGDAVKPKATKQSTASS